MLTCFNGFNRETISLTAVQYVRCIKPNAAKLPGRMENVKVCWQHYTLFWFVVDVAAVAAVAAVADTATVKTHNFISEALNMVRELYLPSEAKK